MSDKPVVGHVSATKGRFLDLALKLSAPGVEQPLIEQRAGGWYEVLASLYYETHRAYHSMSHIANLLSRLDALTEGSRPGLDRLLETEVAIWFHDAVYLVGSPTNEEASALLARGYLFSIGANRLEPERPSIIDKVQAAIMATKHGGGELDGNAARLMVDLDLAGFADPWDVFEDNNCRIRAEYAMYNDDQYCWGRTKFLAGLVSKPIFHILTEFEAPARANIARHVRELHAR